MRPKILMEEFPGIDMLMDMMDYVWGLMLIDGSKSSIFLHLLLYIRGYWKMWFSLCIKQLQDFIHRSVLCCQFLGASSLESRSCPAVILAQDIPASICKEDLQHDATPESDGRGSSSCGL